MESIYKDARGTNEWQLYIWSVSQSHICLRYTITCHGTKLTVSQAVYVLKILLLWHALHARLQISLLSMVITLANVHSACLILISISYIIHKAVSHAKLTLEVCQRVGIKVFMGFIIFPYSYISNSNWL